MNDDGFDAVYTVDIKNLDMRTVKQNAALHLWCTQIAHTLNSSGIYMSGIFGEDYKIEWTMELVKARIVKRPMEAVFNITSTTKMQKKELDELLDYIYDYFSKNGIELPEFPNRELWENKQKQKD